jgi:oxygen-independent coproporphyrinogen-3 oxidase
MNSPTQEFDSELVRRFDRNGPRYTSYPTADRFVDTFGFDAYRAAVKRRNTGGVQRPLSLYVHLPFCRDICYYCACNKIVTRDRTKAEEYLCYLDKEIALQANLFRADPRVVQMHWGGGTPTYYNVETLRGLFTRITGWFDLAPDGDYSIEIDPRTVDASALDELRCIGFNRVSFGVQDFDQQVQIAVHRLQSLEQTRAAIDAARRAKFHSINVDLIYGLPKQTPESLERTVAHVIEERPDRIALYNYAHLPAVFAPQRRIRDADLPSAEARVDLFALAAKRLVTAGYVQIGMDHFALPRDALAVAQRQGRLRRDFQGYSAGAECDVVGLGLSAIGSVGPTYSQNFRALKDYYDRIGRGELAIMRGIELTSDDLVRRAVIQALMCQFALSKEAIEIAHLIAFDRYFAPELEALRALEESGLIEWDGSWLTVTAGGRSFIRGICMIFDRHLANGPDAARYSRVI